MAILRESVLIGEKEIIIETGRMAKQAGGSVLVQCGETVVLVTATEGGPRPGFDFFPLTVEYQEKGYAAGRIPGNYFKREGRLSEDEILVSRLIDRPVRPLFPDGFRNDTQVIATVLSVDMENHPDVLAMTGASAALMISNLPWDGPMVGVRVCMVKGKLIANPSISEQVGADLNIVMACTGDNIVMVEGMGNEVDEDTMLKALDFGFKASRGAIDLQLRLREACGKEKLPTSPKVANQTIHEAVAAAVKGKMRDAITVKAKHERYAAIAALKAEVKAALEARFAEVPDASKEIGDAFDKIKKLEMRLMIVRENVRLDGRGLSDIRKITIEAGVLPRTHGSALFTRGETQALVTLTLATAREAQRIETLLGQETRDFLLHYNFPPFSVGETKPLRGPGRREIGHGNLARRALEAVLPRDKEVWSYTMRLVSETLESNGSSSMATVCGGSLAMMDGGVPLKAPVAGIAMGLIAEEGKYAVLSDILGDEDHLGDMDFKVCGTRNGITAFQMDTKISGVPAKTMRQALLQARDGRVHILGEMEKVISEPRAELNAHAPRIISIKVKPSQIGAIIGSGGKTIRGIIEQTGASIDVEDDGTVSVASSNKASAQKALDMIRALTQEAEVGKIYMGTVKRIMDFGAFIEILPGTEGLCHISELTDGRVSKVEDVVREGEEIMVKCLAVDRSGKIRLSRKEALAEQGT
jgi:polyribonucleotide nucleotidyltransferase